ncbi:MAG: hypothetical protein RO469_16175 [Thermincola sp.]|jgi:hypothetical protein|nr:hypothetical protein [Thermincola sp.]MDT3704782.1 hypothetical protein [Thermincola sp.]
MEALGKIGNIYIVLLFVLLIGGIGVLSLNFSRKLWSRSESLLDKKGGKSVNKWLKLAMISCTGLLAASFIMGLGNSMGFDPGMGGLGGSPAVAASSHNHQPGGQQTGNGAAAANLAGYGQGMNSPGFNLEAQMYVMQNQIMQLQQQLNYMIQLQNRQAYYQRWVP